MELVLNLHVSELTAFLKLQPSMLTHKEFHVIKLHHFTLVSLI